MGVAVRERDRNPLQPTEGDARQPVLLERERELAQLDRLIGDACSGNGRFLVVEASAGLGKTRLLAAARDAASGHLRTLTARGTELERSFPYALIRQLFEPLLSGMAAEEREALFDGAAAARSVFPPKTDGASHTPRWEDKFGVLHGLYWLTAALAERDPLMLLVDDLHWADGSSLEFLSFLLPRLEELPVLLVVACRPDEPGADDGLLRVATDPVADNMSLQPLSSKATGTLLGAQLGTDPDGPFVAACHEVSGGNPFLLSELARTLSARSIAPNAAQVDAVREIAPDRVARAIRGRLNGLSVHARAIAHALAILGDDSEHGLVAELGGLDSPTTLTAADELRAAAILDPGQSLRFIHPLVRTALYADIPAGERTVAHVSAAALLRSRGATPDRLAGHLLVSDARDSRETVETLLAAGMHALSGGAPKAASAYLRRALQEPPPADLRASVLGAVMIAEIRAADFSASDMIQAEIRAELQRSPQLLSHWASLLAVWLALGGRMRQAVPLLAEAIDVALDEKAFDSAFRLEALLSSFARLPPGEVRSRLERYRDGIEPDSPNGRLAAAFDSAWCLVHGEVRQGVAFARSALEDGRIFAEQGELMAPGWAMMTLWSAGALDDAKVAAEHAFDVAREHGAGPEMAIAWSMRGTTAAMAGDLAAAEADHRQAVHAARLAGLRAMMPTLIGALVEALIERGALREAALELERVGEMDSPVAWFAGLEFMRGRLYLAQGKLQPAAEQLLAVQRRQEEWGLDGMPFMQPRVWAARALAGLGDRARACKLAEEELVHARRWGAALPIARAQRALAHAKGDGDRIELLYQAVALLETSPAALDRAHTLFELGSALRRAKRGAEAREPLREALAQARRCGAEGLARHAHAELEATGERVRRYVPMGVDSLTASERRVADMAAEGMTNREIAQTLFLTVKTIESHLTAVYDKLGVRSRQLLPHSLGRDQG